MSQLDRLASMYALFFDPPQAGSAAPLEEDPVKTVTHLTQDVAEALQQLCDSQEALAKLTARLTEMMERRPLSSRTSKRLEACGEALMALQTTFDRLGWEALREVAHIATCYSETLDSMVNDTFAAVA